MDGKDSKEKRKTGFTLAETLVAILILLMVSAIVAGALPVAGRVYTKTVGTANAQVLLSAAMAALRDELSTAADISIHGTTVEYRNAAKGCCRLEIVSAPLPSDEKTEGGIWITYLDDDPLTGEKRPATDRPPRPLVSSKMAITGEPGSLMAIYESVEYKDGRIIFHDLKVLIDGMETPGASHEEFTVRIIAEAEPAPSLPAEAAADSRF